MRERVYLKNLAKGLNISIVVFDHISYMYCVDYIYALKCNILLKI